MTTLERMIEFLPYYLKQGENINKYYKALSEMFDEVIELFIQIQESRDIEKSFGFGLDIIGDIVGVTRQGLEDEAYREILRTRIISNRSPGDIETINNFGRLILKNFFQGIIESNDPKKIKLRYTYPLVNNPVEIMKKIVPVGTKIETKLEGYSPVCGTFKLGQLQLNKKISSI